MKQNTSKFQYAQLEIYKESLELAHLKRKTIIINILMLILGGIVLFFLIKLKSENNAVLSIMTMFLILFVINFAFYSYDNDHYNNLKIAMYINTLGIYSIAVTLIFRYQTPSVFTVLFLAYAITTIYQDFKAMILSNFTLFVAGSLLVVKFPTIFHLVGNDRPQTLYILIFVMIFVLLLTLSSYILIKRKTFFYNQLAKIKESEVRNMELLLEIEKYKTQKDFDGEKYYDSIKNFSNELSKKIGIPNIFDRKINLLKDLNLLTLQEVLSKYPEYSADEVNELMNLEMQVNKKMRMIGIKSSQSFGVEVSRKEIFSESQFKSFNHHGENKYVMIISFVVFYCLLKIDKPYLKGLDEEVIKDVLLNSEYFHRIDKDIINVYLENSTVFDTIVRDHLEVK